MLLADPSYRHCQRRGGLLSMIRPGSWLRLIINVAIYAIASTFSS